MFVGLVDCVREMWRHKSVRSSAVHARARLLEPDSLFRNHDPVPSSPLERVVSLGDLASRTDLTVSLGTKSCSV